jgi:YidC/Oxa1 family membrane protein insertase
MNPIGEIFTLVFINPTINALSLLYHLLVLIHVPAALGFSFILLTIVIRLILYPFTLSQLKTSKKMQDLAPKLSKLKEMHKADAKKLQEETMKLYKEHGVNPAAGCLPLLVQLPLIWGLYNVLQNAVNANPQHVVNFVNAAAYAPFLKLSHAWDPHFFGLPMAQSPQHLLPILGPLVLLVPLLTGALQFVQSKMMIPAVQAEEKVKEEVQREKGQLTKEVKKQDDFQTAFQTQSLYIFPIMIGFFSFTLPVGLSFYWNTFTIFGIIQQYQVQGWGGMKPWIQKLIKKK